MDVDAAPVAEAGRARRAVQSEINKVTTSQGPGRARGGRVLLTRKRGRHDARMLLAIHRRFTCCCASSAVALSSSTDSRRAGLAASLLANNPKLWQVVKSEMYSSSKEMRRMVQLLANNNIS